MKNGDKFLFIIIGIALLVSAYIKLFPVKTFQPFVEIRVDGKIFRDISLDSIEQEVQVQSSEGHLIVQIQSKKVRVLDSSCRDKLCIKQGWIYKVGETVVCLPNRVSVSIIGGKNAVDTTTY